MKYNINILYNIIIANIYLNIYKDFNFYHI